MPAKISTHVFKGMQKDINVVNSSNEYLFDAHNIRLNLLDDNTLMSIVNEKGNELITFQGDVTAIEGNYVSSYVVDNHIVVFTHNVENELNVNRIYRIDADTNSFTLNLLFEGNLNISPLNPLEFTSYFESNKVIKIYWVDGVNQLRFMNIMVDEPYTDPNDFNTTPELRLNETVTVELIEGNGEFPAGVILYAFTYINELGAESNIFYTTKLKSIMFNDKAGAPDKTTLCAFKITISNVDTSFNYIRCYQLLRTSLDMLPTCLLLNEIQTNSTVTIIDVNEGATYDSTALLFAKYPIVPHTLDLKSNTLFLGNISEDSLLLENDDITLIRDIFAPKTKIRYTDKQVLSEIEDTDNIRFVTEDDETFWETTPLRFGNAVNQRYEVDIQKEDLDIIRTFKSNETYRIAVLLLDKYGIWSEPVFLDDITVNSRQLSENNVIHPISLIFDKSNIDLSKVTALSAKFKRFRFLMVNPTAANRHTFALGIIIPTLLELSDRVKNSPFSYSSWFSRPFGMSSIAHKHYEDIYAGAIEMSGEPSADIETKAHKNTLSEIQAKSIFYYGTEGLINYDWWISAAEGDLDFLTHNLSIGIVFEQSSGNSFKVRMASGWDLSLNVGSLYTASWKDNETVHYLELHDTEVIQDYINQQSYPSWGDCLKAICGNIVSHLFAKYPNGVLNTLITQLHLTPPITTGSFTWNNNYLVRLLYNLLSATMLNYPLSFPTAPSISFNIDKQYTVDNRTLVVDLMNFVAEVLPIGIDGGSSISYDNSIVSIDFKVDHSVLNLYSPDIDNNWDCIDNNDTFSLDIIGYNGITTIQDNTFIETSTPGSSPYYEVKTRYSTLKNSGITEDYDHWVTRALYEDGYIILKENSDGKHENNYTPKSNTYPYIEGRTTYLTYPWHNAGGLNSDDNTNGENRSAKYTRKIFARLWQCTTGKYFNVLHGFSYDENIPGVTVLTPRHRPLYGITGTVRVCNSTNNLILFKQDGLLRSYMPNPDIARTTVKAPYYFVNMSGHTIKWMLERAGIDVDNIEGGKALVQGYDPVQIKYNCDTHVVIPIDRQEIISNNSSDYRFSVLPSLVRGANDYENTLRISDKYRPLWDWRYKFKDSAIVDYYQDEMYPYPHFLIGELYREVVSLYGGNIPIDTTGNNNRYDRNNPVLLSNVFIPVTDSIDINVLSDNTISYISSTYGDTWYGTWDCLKTQEMTNLDLLSVYDYVSIIIESHINLNGRYDSYKNFYDLTLVNILNANKFNDAYNLMDTFWSYKVIPNYLKTTYYPNQITWSLTKNVGSLVDEWTRVTAANIEQLDGNKGPINKILNYKDSLFVFQDKCISLIKYNELTLMTTTEGVPVEISNSLKVTGVVKIYDGTGCINKWSIASDANGIFFVDNVNECMMWLGGSLDTPIVNLTNSKAFTLFMKANNSFDVWNPEDFSNFVTFIDSAHKDVYFVNNNTCLCFSLALLEFTSFYSYEGTFNMFNIDNNFYSLYNKNGVSLYRNFTGKYNEIYGVLQPSNFIFIDHGESFLTDKTFTNINYIQDAYNVNGVDGLLTQSIRFTDDYDNTDYYYEKDVTFLKLRVWTPFLDTGDITLTPNEDLQRKFRTWGILISRDLKYNISNVDRIRNNWAKFKFTFTQPDYNLDGTIKLGVVNPRDIKIELMNINVLSIE